MRTMCNDDNDIVYICSLNRIAKETLAVFALFITATKELQISKPSKSAKSQNSSEFVVFWKSFPASKSHWLVMR